MSAENPLEIPESESVILDRSMKKRGIWFRQGGWYRSPAFKEKLQQLQAKYGKSCTEYKMYHLFVGSSAPSACNKLDFPENDSIEKFLDEQVK